MQLKPSEEVLKLMPPIAVVVSTLTTSTAVAGCSHIVKELPAGKLMHSIYVHRMG
mgnify:CR=1 FL=1